MSDNNNKNMACSTKPDWWQTVMLWRDNIDEPKSDEETPASQQLSTLLQTNKQLVLLTLQKACRGDGIGVLEDVRTNGLREWRTVELNLLYEVMGKLRADIWKQVSNQERSIAGGLYQKALDITRLCDKVRLELLWRMQVTQLPQGWGQTSKE